MPGHALTLRVLIGLAVVAAASAQALFSRDESITVKPSFGHPSAGNVVTIDLKGALAGQYTTDGCKEVQNDDKPDAGQAAGACPVVRFGHVHAQHVQIVKGNPQQLQVVSPVVGYGMTGEARFVDINIELPTAMGNMVGVTAPEKSWEYLCDCEATCEQPRTNAFFAPDSGACDAPGDNCCVAGGAYFKCARGSACCNGFCCPSNSQCQTCNGMSQCSAPTA